ncbi:MAG: outer membrane protein transport protein [Alphaproteobacteria bacterium]|nr:outer membrane protein transport protein [Alphaproteobacteria bacterium]
MKKIYLAAAATLLCASQANAAGYQLNEFSATGLGRAFAGSGIMGDDFSALGYNPAGMTANKNSGVQLGIAATEIASKAKSKYGTDKMDYFVPLPSFISHWTVNNKLFLGFGVYVTYGLSTKYKHDSNVATKSAGGARKSYLEVIDTNLSAAYRFDSGLSLGASAILRHISGQLTSNLNSVNALVPGADLYSDFKVKGWSHTYQLGAMYDFDENTRVGLSYRFKSTQRTKGKHYISSSSTNPMIIGGLEAMGLVGRFHSASDPELPASWILSGFHKWNNQWGTSATVKYVQWHRFYTFPGESTWPGLQMAHKQNLDVDYKWKDAWTFALGQEYYMNENWTLRAGAAWDQSPSAGSGYRTNRIPDTDRIWTSLGASYATGNHQFDLGYAHLFMMHGSTRNQPSDLEVKYHNHSNMFALQYQYKF